jgi:hypothetical protein
MADTCAGCGSQPFSRSSASNAVISAHAIPIVGMRPE